MPNHVPENFCDGCEHAGKWTMWGHSCKQPDKQCVRVERADSDCDYCEGHGVLSSGELVGQCSCTSVKGGEQ